MAMIGLGVESNLENQQSLETAALLKMTSDQRRDDEALYTQSAIKAKAAGKEWGTTCTDGVNRNTGIAAFFSPCKYGPGGQYQDIGTSCRCDEGFGFVAPVVLIGGALILLLLMRKG